LHGNGSVNRCATGFENIKPGLRSQRVGRGNGELVGDDVLFVLVARSDFGLLGQ
jgi:hypothetical protein